jgi:hypothetical protein
MAAKLSKKRYIAAPTLLYLCHSPPCQQVTRIPRRITSPFQGLRPKLHLLRKVSVFRETERKCSSSCQELQPAILVMRFAEDRRRRELAEPLGGHCPANPCPGTDAFGVRCNSQRRQQGFGAGGRRRNLRRARPVAHDQWHLDDMVVSIAGLYMDMWRAVDSEGEALDVLVQPRRDGATAQVA